MPKSGQNLKETFISFEIEACGLRRWQKLGQFLWNKLVQKLKFSKMFSWVNILGGKSFSKNEDISKLFWKSEFSLFCHLCIPPFQKIPKFPFNPVTFRQKSSKFCKPIIDTPKPKSCYYAIAVREKLHLPWSEED